jgi:hypothetical protein
MTWKLRGKLGAYGPGSYWAPAQTIVLARGTAGTPTENVFFVCPDFTSDSGLGPGNVADLQPYGQTSLYVVKAAYISPDATITGQATNYVTLNINRYNSAGTQYTGAAGVVASLAFSTGSVVATLKARLSLGAIASAAATLATGDVLTIQWAVTGTGLTTPQCVVSMDFV